jgi:hypothetical protein
VNGLWKAIRNLLGFGKRRGGLRWQRIKDAKQTEFFRWFSFVENGVAKDEGGNTIISFRPEGEKFRSLVKLDAVLDEEGRIAGLHLSLVKSFVDDDRDGIFARDIAKSFLRSAFPEADNGAVTVLADEIEGRHNFPVITHASSLHPELPLQPTAGFLTYIGRQQLYEESYSRSSLRIEQTRTEDGEAVVITVRASR